MMLPFFSFSSFLQGMLMAFTISNFMGTLLNLHYALRRPMTKSAVLAICRMAELLKSIQATYHRSSLQVIDYISLSVNEYEIIILDALERMTVCSIFLSLSLSPYFLLLSFLFCVFHISFLLLMKFHFL